MSLPSPEEMVGIMRLMVPRWIKDKDESAIEEFVKKMQAALVTAIITDGEDLPLCVEYLVAILWLTDQATGQKHRLDGRPTRPDPAPIRVFHDSPLDDNTATDACVAWLLRPSTNAFQREYSLAAGRVLAVSAKRQLDVCATSVVSPPYGHAEQLCDQLATLVTQLSKQCKFERTQDEYLFRILRSKLSPSRHALLAASPASPFEQTSGQFPGLRANEIIRPFIESTPDAVCTNVDWKTGHTDAFYIMVFSILRESLDNFSAPLLTDTEIPQHVNYTMPVPIIITRQFDPDNPKIGYIFEDTIYNVDTTKPFPIPSLLLCWAEHCISVLPDTNPFCKTMIDFQQAVVFPEGVLPSNPFYRLLYPDETE